MYYFRFSKSPPQYIIARPAPYQLRTLSVPTLSLCIVCKVCCKLCKELAFIVSRDKVSTTILLSQQVLCLYVQDNYSLPRFLAFQPSYAWFHQKHSNGATLLLLLTLLNSFFIPPFLVQIKIAKIPPVKFYNHNSYTYKFGIQR